MSYVKIYIQDLFVPNIANCCNTIYTNQAIEDALSSFANKPITRRLKDGSEEVIGIITNSKDGYLFGELYPTIQLLEYREENGIWSIGLK